MPSVVITTTGSGSWTVPAGVTSVTAELWSGGQGGDAGSGGRGGNYIRKASLAVTPGSVISYNVGAGGAGVGFASKNNGGATWFVNATTYVAAAGGLTTGSAGGDVAYYGGQGGSGSVGVGGGGGGSSHSAGAGGAGGTFNGSNPASVAGGASGSRAGGAQGQPGVSDVEGGSGGGGYGAGATVNPGGAPGGGGGGGRDSGPINGGDGGRGQIRLTYEVVPQTVQVITTTGSGSWTVPAGVTSVKVECWGGGGAGAIGAAGGGGAWSSATLAVTAGQSLTYYIAPAQPYSGTGAKTVGYDTWFGSPTSIMAKGADGHLGGQASAGRGSQKFSGGSATSGVPMENGTPSASAYGGSGAAASPYGNGGDGLYDPSKGTGAGGASPGAGAAGQSNVDGGGGGIFDQSGAASGGSPGGGSRSATSTRGQIRLTYDVGAAPPADTTPPTITSAASVSVAENTVNPTGTLTANEAVTWSKNGGADAALFSLSGSTWTLNATPDFETKSSYVVVWRAVDAAGNGTNQTFTLTITDVDEIAPIITSSATPSVAENNAGATGTLTANEAVTWSKVGGADAASFSLSGATWTLNVTPDYETKASYVVTWRATDAAGNWSEQTMTLAITDVDETPAVGEEVTEQFKTPGAISWTVPTGVTSVTAQVWGPGGAGADGTSSRAGGGGGGGGFRQATAYPVTPGQTISLRVGAQGTSSFFVSTSVCQANSGGASTGQGPGAAGTHSGSAAGFGFNGGAGNWGGGGATANGGSAGSSASPTSNGAPNGLGDGELRGGGGSYGNYGTLSPAGPGQQPGGGGGGGYSNSPGGAGGAGQIFLTYTRSAGPARRAPRSFFWF